MSLRVDLFVDLLGLLDLPPSSKLSMDCGVVTLLEDLRPVTILDVSISLSFKFSIILFSLLLLLLWLRLLFLSVFLFLFSLVSGAFLVIIALLDVFNSSFFTLITAELS